jgi:hypothetical protein
MSPTELKMQHTIHLEAKAGHQLRPYAALRSKCIVGCIFIPSGSLSRVKFPVLSYFSFSNIFFLFLHTRRVCIMYLKIVFRSIFL